jgi:AraC-like DNA-binding protein
MYRRRRVRHSYPPAVLALALRLLKSHDVKATSKILSIRLSTLYRWRPPHGAGHEDENRNAADSKSIGDLVRDCESAGFAVHKNLILLDNEATDVSEPELHHRRESSIGPCPVDTRESAPGSSGIPGEQPTFHAPRVPVHRQVADPNFPGVVDATRPSLLAVHKLIQEKYNTHIGCEDLARTASMSRSHFINSYRRAFGESPYRHLLRLRVDRAAALLQSTRERADIIAIAVGFDSHASLAKAFRSIRGTRLREFCSQLPDLSPTTSAAPVIRKKVTANSPR